MPQKPQAQPKPDERELRNEFAREALREIVAYQLANGKFGEQSLAATLAFRWADCMVAQSKQPPARMTVMVKGSPVVYETPLPQDEIVHTELPEAPLPA